MEKTQSPMHTVTGEYTTSVYQTNDANTLLITRCGYGTTYYSIAEMTLPEFHGYEDKAKEQYDPEGEDVEFKLNELMEEDDVFNNAYNLDDDYDFRNEDVRKFINKALELGIFDLIV